MGGVLQDEAIPRECYACYEATDPNFDGQFGGNCFKPDEQTGLSTTNVSEGIDGCWTMYGYQRESGAKTIVRGLRSNNQKDRCDERKMSEISKTVSCKNRPSLLIDFSGTEVRQKSLFFAPSHALAMINATISTSTKR